MIIIVPMNNKFTVTIRPWYVAGRAGNGRYLNCDADRCSCEGGRYDCEADRGNCDADRGNCEDGRCN